MTRTSRVLTLACILGVGTSFASVSFVTTLGGLGTTDDTFTWGQLGADGATVNNNFTATSTSLGTLTGAFSNGNLTGIVGEVCPGTPCVPAAPGFVAGDFLLQTSDVTTPGTAPLTLTFNDGTLTAVGFYIQSAFTAGAFSANVTVFSGATNEGAMNFNSDGSADPLFVGALATPDTPITSIQIKVQNCDGGSCSGKQQKDFFLDQVDINSVPEPSSFALLGAGLLGLGWRLRRLAR
jgi:hypothetical protein